MATEPAGTGDAGVVTDQWVALAADQRAHGSHILAEANRTVVREAVLRHVVADELLVARKDGEIVGFVMFTIEGGRYEQDATRGVVQNLYVVPDYRKEGIGGDLLTAAEAHLAARDADVVTLDVMAANEDARRLYQRHGYRPYRVELEKSLESDTP